MTTINVTLTHAALDQLKTALTLLDDPTGPIKASFHVGQFPILDREPAEGYMWRGQNFHPSCLIEAMILDRELSPAARDMLPAEAIRQRNNANGFTITSGDCWHIEPTHRAMECPVCGLGWPAPCVACEQ